MSTSPAIWNSTFPGISDNGNIRNASSSDNVLPTVTAGVSIFVVLCITGVCIWMQRRKYFRKRKASRTNSDYIASYSSTNVNEGSDVRKKSCQNADETRSERIVKISDCSNDSSSNGNNNNLAITCSDGDLKSDQVATGESVFTTSSNNQLEHSPRHVESSDGDLDIRM